MKDGTESIELKAYVGNRVKHLDTWSRYANDNAGENTQDLNTKELEIFTGRMFAVNTLDGSVFANLCFQ